MTTFPIRSTMRGAWCGVRAAALLSCALAIVGCPSRTDDVAPAPAARSNAAPEPAKTRVSSDPEPLSAEAARLAASLPRGEVTRSRGEVTDGPLPITGLLGKTPPEVEAQLAEPLGKGMARRSCVRFVPDRVWFECQYAWQRYGDKTGTYAAVQVSYEDGVATGVAFEGIPGEGPFDPKAALAKVGVRLPGEPRVSEPAPDTRVWSWFNDEARLLIHGKQYRVEVSSVGDAWETSKVELFLNHPLDEAQKAKIKQPGGNEPSEPTAEGPDAGAEEAKAAAPGAP